MVAKKLIHTPQQATVITHREGPLFVLSGAGSGKTASTSQRALAMIEEGMPVDWHIVLTFSRKATGEFRDRLSGVMSPQEILEQVTTYHGFCWRFLRHFPEHCDRAKGVTLLDENDQWRLFREAAELTQIGQGLQDQRTVLNRILKHVRSQYSLVRNHNSRNHATHRALLERRLDAADVISAGRIGAAIDVIDQYERLTRERNVVDFDHLLLLVTRAVRGSEKAQQWLQRRYRYLTVDEAQDTNGIQYELIRMLAGHRNIVMVGDDDQVLFTWRGARSSNLQMFVDEFQPQTVYLSQNWRSKANIVSAAANMIEINSARLPKETPFSNAEPGLKPQVQCLPDDFTMGEHLATQIEASLAEGVAPNEIAVLYRTKRMSRVVEPELRRRGIPYRIVGNRSLFDTNEVRSAVSAVRLLTNHKDKAAWMRLGANLAGVGEKTLEAAFGAVAAQEPSPLISDASLSMVMEKLPKRQAEAVEKMHVAIGSMLRFGADRIGHWLLDDDGMGLRSQWRSKGEKHAAVLKRIEANLGLFDEVNARAIADLSDELPWDVVMENVLSDAVPESPDHADPSDAVTLSTIHRAKGLEWEVVHVAGASDGILPLKASIEDDQEDEFVGGYEEERRLAYVAVTRAKDKCVLWHANQMLLPGSGVQTYAPSPFLYEMKLDMPATCSPQAPPEKTASHGDKLLIGL